MISHRCKNCLWWDNQHPAVHDIPEALGKKVLGYCRKKHPGGLKIGSYHYGVQIVTDADDFCGEFKTGEK